MRLALLALCLLAALALGLRWFVRRPSNLPATYARVIAGVTAGRRAAPLLTEQDLASLPPLVQTYLRRVGVVGQPRPLTARARFQGQFRQGPDASWMTVHGEQVNSWRPFARYFLMRASLRGLPFVVLHIYADGAASMRARVLSLVDVVDVHDAELLRSETVTVLNDLCVLAPGALVDAPVTWTPRDATSVGVTFTSAGQTVHAVLVFDAQGDLADFVSDDRAQSDGRTVRRLRWSTPVGDYRDFHGLRLPSRGEARWHEPGGAYAYARLRFDDIAYNVTAAP